VAVVVATAINGFVLPTVSVISGVVGKDSNLNRMEFSKTVKLISGGEIVSVAKYIIFLLGWTIKTISTTKTTIRIIRIIIENTCLLFPLPKVMAMVSKNKF
jgi:hypothetical protein